MDQACFPTSPCKEGEPGHKVNLRIVSLRENGNVPQGKWTVHLMRLCEPVSSAMPAAGLPAG